MTAAKHPLVGKIVRIDQGDYYQVSRFTADLGHGMMLARRISPHTGKDLRGEHVIVVAELTESDFTEIYESFDDLLEDDREYEGGASPRVVRLVPKPDKPE